MLKSSPLLFFTFILVLGACSENVFREVSAKHLASPSNMFERRIETNQFSLVAYEKIHERGGDADIYIEGDGPSSATPIIWDIFKNPTPTNPVGLHLATRDKADNVIYISRPCMYGGLQTDEEAKGEYCAERYWSTHRYSREVVDALKESLDNIKHRYDIQRFHLVGYGGGANLAAVIAGERADVASLRTVAGNLNPDLAKIRVPRKDEPLVGVISAMDYKKNLRYVPQLHVIGGQDDEVHPNVLHSYLAALGETNCVRYQLIQEATHEKGWVDKWYDLLKKPVHCRGEPEDVAVQFEDRGYLIEAETLPAPAGYEDDSAPISLLNN